MNLLNTIPKINNNYKTLYYIGTRMLSIVYYDAYVYKVRKKSVVKVNNCMCLKGS